MTREPESDGVGATAVTGIDGSRGTLTYRGFRVEDVVAHFGYEQTVGLLLDGNRPDAPQAQELRTQLAARRTLPPELEGLVDRWPATAPVMDGLRTGISGMVDLAREAPPTRTSCLDLIARTPTLVARLYRRSVGASPVPPDPELGHVANFLWMVEGTAPGPPAVRALERYFVLLADHGISASTYVLRIVLSTRSDLVSAVTAAVGALKGPLHGGAPPEVLTMLDAAGPVDRVESWIDRTLSEGGRLYGFGHPTYRVEDPRATLLRGYAAEVVSPDRYAVARRFEQVALERLRRRRPGIPLFTNVDFYGALLLEAVGLPRELLPPTFALARMAGWSAHALEQVRQNRLVRPPERYTGPSAREWDGAPPPTGR
jgi:citrate synthase